LPESAGYKSEPVDGAHVDKVSAVIKVTEWLGSIPARSTNAVQICSLIEVLVRKSWFKSNTQQWVPDGSGDALPDVNRPLRENKLF